MTKITKLLVLTSLSILFFSDYALAAGKMKPGLWEMTMQSDAMKAMPKIPPEQLEQMKKMGVKIPVMQDGAMKTSVCISKEMAEQDHPAAAQNRQTNCKSQNVTQNGNEYSMDLICDGPELKGVGSIKGRYNNGEGVSSTYDFKGTSHNRPITHHTETTGKWISSDCGDVKPVTDFTKSK